MEAYDPRHGKFEHQEYSWQAFKSRGPLDIVIYETYKLWTTWFKRSFLKSPHYKSMGAIASLGLDSLDPWGLNERIHVGTTRLFYILNI